MASFTEASVRVVVRIVRDSGSGAVTLHAAGQSLDANGRVIRTVTTEITEDVSQARRDGAQALIEDIEARLKLLWNIP